MSFPIFIFLHHASTSEIFPLSLHDALPICGGSGDLGRLRGERDPRPLRRAHGARLLRDRAGPLHLRRSEEHTSELQSRGHLVCRLLLEKKKKARSSSSPTYANDSKNRSQL